ncbi:acetolactate synthase [Trichophyton tonsurans CBS 112818]|uniref:acetolactate synthase n=1 Tax=Trichophyton tonsurans (strain CBS 112818) TaxID=647933 RepID=F2RUL4_TRIT1|nr:acetolactate synthase [Trichophyton tonsurans CBS 112818]
MMLSASRASRSALRTANCLSHTSQASRRQFSATAVASALSPHRRPSQKAGTLDTSKRGQSTATASSPQARPVPSPAFNQDAADRHDISPLHRRHAPALDDSFVGLSGGQIFHEMMLRLGVKHIFGYPGGAILPVFDAIYNSTHFDFVLPRHEQGAGHMAEGYARATGKPGVVLVTSGPGATNVITPMQDALSEWHSHGCLLRTGPVLVDLPKDVTGGILRKAIPMASSIPAHPSAASIAARKLSRQQLEASIHRVAKLVNVSKKPVLYVGQGLSARPEGPALLKELADKANIPVTTTLQGLGGFDELDPKSLHMLGMHGSAYANMAMQEADLIIALGARFDDRVTGNIAKFAPQAKAAALEGRGGIVHFEVMPKNINKVVEATEAVEGDCADNLAILLPHVNPVAERPEWFAQINDWKARFPLSAYDRQTANGLIKPQAVIEKLSEMTAHRKDKTVITTGVGQHQMWAAQHFRWRHPRSMITSGGLGTMGYGLPSAIGAKVARPDALVIDIDGDASFNMTLTELSTAAQFNIGVKVIVLNNEEQGMVTQWQSLFYEDRFAHTHHKNPDFVKVSEAMGVQARRCLTPDQVESSLQWLINSEGPALLEIATDKKVPVLPMVPAGKALHEFLVYDEAKEKERRALMKKRSGH